MLLWEHSYKHRPRLPFRSENDYIICCPLNNTIPPYVSQNQKVRHLTLWIVLSPRLLLVKIWKFGHQIFFLPIFNFFFFLFGLVFQDRVYLCSPGWPGSHSLDQAGLELRDQPVSAGIKGVHLHHPAVFKVILEAWVLTVTRRSRRRLPVAPGLLPEPALSSLPSWHHICFKSTWAKLFLSYAASCSQAKGVCLCWAQAVWIQPEDWAGGSNDSVQLSSYPLWLLCKILPTDTFLYSNTCLCIFWTSSGTHCCLAT